MTSPAKRGALAVLVADDDQSILNIVSRILQLNGFFPVTAQDGRSALNLFGQLNPVLVILDVTMPEMDGLSVCREIRQMSDVPVIVLTALSDESDAALALEAGADDFVRKPFGTSEFVARVKAVLRRARVETPSPQRLVAGPLIVDERRHVIELNGDELTLSRTEFSLLAYLVRNQNRVLTHDQILERVWGSEYVGSHHVLRVTMSRLRQKLELEGGLLVETLTGVGYRLRTPAGTT